MARKRAANDPAVRVELSPRQREVLELVARGHTNGEIAERLGISLDGVKWHVREILSRLGVDSREEAAAWWRGGGRKPRWLRGWGPRPVAVGAGAALGAIGLVTVGMLVVAAFNDGTSSQTTGTPDFTATATPLVRTATPAGTPAGPTVVPTPAEDYAAVALATGNLRDDTAAVLTTGQPVELTCHEAQVWERPSTAEMSETFTFYRFGNGEHPYPGLYALYLSDVLYQVAPWANSANIEFWSMSGLGGGNDRSRAAPQLCPARDRADHETTMPQAVYLVGLRPLAVLERDGHAVVVVETDPGVLHKIAFERPICCPGKDGPTPFGRMDVVTTDGWLRFVQTGGDKWQADGGEHLEFVLVGSQVGSLPGDLPLPRPFDAYASDVEWRRVEPGSRPSGATIGHLIESPLHSEVRMLFLPAGSPIP